MEELLSHLNADLQKKLLPIFHYALKSDGLLLLGPSETIGSFTSLFEPLDKRWKIFRRKETATAVQVLPRMPALPRIGDEGTSTLPTITSPGAGETQISSVIERLLLGRFAPAGVVVNERGDIVYVHGRTGIYLEPTQGRPRNNVLEMAREGLQTELAGTMRQCRANDADVTREGIWVKTNGEFANVDVTVAKIREPASVRGLLMVTFRPTPAAKSRNRKKSGRGTEGEGEHLEQLQRELQYLKESHQTTLEELETSNEELKSTNEELQSTNEELTTVNTELQTKVDDLSQANSDMQNLLNSTDIATVFLDSDLNIMRFTEQAKGLVMLRPTDVGQPISDLASNLENHNLTAYCRDVLKTLVYHESEVRSKDGDWYLMRIIPYRTTENVIDGLVITFTNIQQLKTAEKAGELRAFFESIVNTVRHPLVVLDEERHVVLANRFFCDLFRLRPKQVMGKSMTELGDGAWNIDELRELLEEILPENAAFEDFKVDHEFPGVGRKILLLNARRLEREQGLPGMILLAMEDVTRKET